MEPIHVPFVEEGTDWKTIIDHLENGRVVEYISIDCLDDQFKTWEELFNLLRQGCPDPRLSLITSESGKGGINIQKFGEKYGKNDLQFINGNAWSEMILTLNIPDDYTEENFIKFVGSMTCHEFDDMIYQIEQILAKEFLSHQCEYRVDESLDQIRNILQKVVDNRRECLARLIG
jgi:hypothetical protein